MSSLIYHHLQGKNKLVNFDSASRSFTYQLCSVYNIKVEWFLDSVFTCIYFFPFYKFLKWYQNKA